MLNRMFVRNAAQVVAQDRSVGGEGLNFSGMELEGGGLEHGPELGLGMEGRHAWLVDAVHRTELHWEAREDMRFGGLEEGEIDPEGGP